MITRALRTAKLRRVQTIQAGRLRRRLCSSASASIRSSSPRTSALLWKLFSALSRLALAFRMR